MRTELLIYIILLCIFVAIIIKIIIDALFEINKISRILKTVQRLELKLDGKIRSDLTNKDDIDFWNNEEF